MISALLAAVAALAVSARRLFKRRSRKLLIRAKAEHDAFETTHPVPFTEEQRQRAIAQRHKRLTRRRK